MKNINSVLAAYLFAWAIFFVFQWSVARRMDGLRGEIDRIKQAIKPGK